MDEFPSPPKTPVATSLRSPRPDRPRFKTSVGRLPRKAALPAILSEGLRSLFPPEPSKSLPEKFDKVLRQIDQKGPSGGKP